MPRNFLNSSTKLSWFLVMSLSLFFVLVFSGRVFALTVSPVLLSLQAEPGQTINQEIKLSNEGIKPLDLTGSIKNFVAAPDGDGEPLFVGDSPQSLTAWAKISPNKITLQPGQVAEATLSINWPTSLSGGGYYAGVIWSGQTSGAVKGVDIISQVAAPLILSSVPGETNVSFQIKGLKLDGKKFFGLPKLCCQFFKGPW